MRVSYCSWIAYSVGISEAFVIDVDRLFPLLEDPAASLTRRQPPLTEVASDQVFELARAWLNDCEENHTKCSRSNFIPKLPTYVVDVSPPSSSGIARLYKPAEGERAKYLCLSYCWGTTGQATTTQTTLKAFLQELPISRLGLTIQDAIETTRRLGFQYLWVDALCIVQDDSTQKHVEIKAMSHTYKNATAVICAAAASASSDGFLRMDRGIYKPSPPLPFEFQVDLPGDVTGNLTLVQAEKFDQVDPLDKRAWALQETLLSARKFVFSSAELLVECREHNRRAFRESYINYAAHVYNSVPAISTWNWNTVDCTNRWFKLLVEYSQRSLTDRNDRLDAFQGIADEIQELSGKPVRYGIPEFASATPAWRTTMPALTRSDRAPSWSWGCLDSHVQFTDHAYYKSKATIRFPSDDESKMGLTACMISGADWTRSLDRDTTWWPDLTVGLPRPLSRFYLLLGYWNGNGDSNADDGLVLESVGDGVYRRTGAFMTKAFQGSWPAQPQEITLV